MSIIGSALQTTQMHRKRLLPTSYHPRFLFTFSKWRKTHSFHQKNTYSGAFLSFLGWCHSIGAKLPMGHLRCSRTWISRMTEIWAVFRSTLADPRTFLLICTSRTMAPLLRARETLARPEVSCGSITHVAVALDSLLKPDKITPEVMGILCRSVRYYEGVMIPAPPRRSLVATKGSSHVTNLLAP